MPQYYPIDVGVSFNCDHSDLHTVHWDVNCFSAVFLLPDQEEFGIRVHFDGDTVVRLLDEFMLSTEDDSDNSIGRVPLHFAYRVVGAPFFAMQSQVWKMVHGPIEHYQFVTGNGCADVLSAHTPSFEVVPL